MSLVGKKVEYIVPGTGINPSNPVSYKKGIILDKVSGIYNTNNSDDYGNSAQQSNYVTRDFYLIETKEFDIRMVDSIPCNCVIKILEHLD